jgi:hypothetical protein
MTISYIADATLTQMGGKRHRGVGVPCVFMGFNRRKMKDQRRQAARRRKPLHPLRHQRRTLQRPGWVGSHIGFYPFRTD